MFIDSCIFLTQFQCGWFNMKAFSLSLSKKKGKFIPSQNLSQCPSRDIFFKDCFKAHQVTVTGNRNQCSLQKVISPFVLACSLFLHQTQIGLSVPPSPRDRKQSCSKQEVNGKMGPKSVKLQAGFIVTMFYILLFTL